MTEEFGFVFLLTGPSLGLKAARAFCAFRRQLFRYFAIRVMIFRFSDRELSTNFGLPFYYELIPVANAQPLCAMAATASSTFLADELEAVEAAQAALGREQQRRTNDATTRTPSTSTSTSNTTTPPSTLQSIPPSQRLPMLQRQVSDLELASDYAAYLRQYHPADSQPPSGFGIDSLTAEVESVTALGHILYRHSPCDPPRRSKRTRHDPTHQPAYTRILQEGYRPFHALIRAKLLLEFRRCLRTSSFRGGSDSSGGAYPTPMACRSLRHVLEQSVAPEREGGGAATDLTTVAALLVRIQLHHDALMAHLNATEGNYYGDETGGYGVDGIRLDVVDELIGPLVKRVEFHFLDDSSGGGGGGDVGGSGSGRQVRITSSNLAELPRWLFRYVQNFLSGAEEGENTTTIKEESGDDCGIIGVLLDGLLPVMQTEAEKYRMSVQQQQESNGANDRDESNATRAVNRADAFLRHHPFASPSSSGALISYLMSEVSSISMSVLRRRGYIHHLSSRTPVEAGAKALVDGIEQCLRFDVFAQEIVAGESDQHTGVTCLKDGITLKLVLESPPLLDLWIDVDRRTGLDSLRDAPVLVSQPEAIVPLSPLAETYAALIASTLTKSFVLKSSVGAKRKYVAGTAVPLTTYFMDCMHEAASKFCDAMHRAAGRRSADMDLEALLVNLQDWLDLICGMDLARLALESSPSNSTNTMIIPPAPDTPMTPFTPASQQVLTAKTPDTRGMFRAAGATPGEQDQDLLRLSQSLFKLRTAMIDEYSSTLVETVLMERCGFAGYFMTAPHRLMGDLMGGITVSPREGGTISDMPATSKELERPLGVLLSILDQLCTVHSSNEKTGSARHSPSKEQIDLMDDSVTAVISNVGNRIVEKFFELATDPSGSIPEFQRSGALQLLADVQLLHAMFDSVTAVMNDAPEEYPAHTTTQPEGIFGRLVVLIRLMAADDSQIQSLRDGLYGLAADSMPHLSPGLHHIPSQPFEADGTLYETARSMLESKGFGGVELEDAILVLNRRNVKSSSVAEALGRL